MGARLQRTAEIFRTRGLSVAVAVALLASGVAGVRWILAQRDVRPARKGVQLRVVNVQPQPVQKPPPPPPPAPPKEIEEAPTRRVDLDPEDLEEAPPPPADAPPPAGPLAIAASADGPGDAFNLVGNPGGRSLLGAGGLRDGSGTAAGGLGQDDPRARHGWYFVKVAAQIEDALRRHERLRATAIRVELRVWTDPSGRIERIEPVRSTGDAEIDDAIRSVAGLRLREPPPRDLPMPMIARLTARRPQ